MQMFTGAASPDCLEHVQLSQHVWESLWLWQVEMAISLQGPGL